MPDEKPIYTNRSAHLVKSVREKFLEVYESAKDEFDEYDVEKVKNDDWFVKRFLLARNRNEKNALKMLIAAMKWRKAKNFRNMTTDMFPAEFYKLGAIFLYCDDKEGNATYYFRIKYLYSFPELNDVIKTFGTYLLYTIDEKINGNGISVVIDFSDCGFKNCEFDVLRYSIQVLTQYFPAGLNHILVVNLPFIFRSFWFTTKGWIPENRRKLLKFVTHETITDYIDTENLPKFLGGTCERPYNGDAVVPPNCITGFQYGINIGVPEKRCNEIFDFYKPLLGCLE